MMSSTDDVSPSPPTPSSGAGARFFRGVATRLKVGVFSACMLAATVYTIHAQSQQYGIDLTGVTCTPNCFASIGFYVDSSGNVVSSAGVNSNYIISQGALYAAAGGSTGPLAPNGLLRFNGIAPTASTTISSPTFTNAPSNINSTATTWIEIQDGSNNKYYIPAFSSH
jgi:hypothetical protein